jgi:hypothetical protein
VQGEIAAIDGGVSGHGIFRDAAASVQKLPIDDADREPAGVIGLDTVRDLQQFLDCGVNVYEGPTFLELHCARNPSAMLM